MNKNNTYPWIQKYSPKTIREIVGQDAAIARIKNFINNFVREKKRALILTGPSGTGKTLTAHLIAKELGYELLEINASDTRNAQNIEQIIGNASRQKSLFAKGKIILIDEADGIAGQEDRGGIQALAKIIENSKFPFILTMQDASEKKFSLLKKLCEIIDFQPLKYEDIFKKLKQISKEEGIIVEDNALKTLARRAGGDMRAAINDLQNLSQNKKIDKKIFENLDERDKQETIENTIIRIFKTTDEKIALQAIQNVEEEHDEIMLWIDWNLPFEYINKEELWKAYEKLSRSDVFNGRIKKWQYWRFLVYIHILISAGVALAKKERYNTNLKYVQSMRLLRTWQLNQKNYWRKTIAEKIAEKTHTSSKRTIHDTIPYLKYIIKQNKSVISELELEEEEIKWLKK